MLSFSILCFRSYIVYILLQSRVNLRSKLKPITLKKRYHQIILTAAIDRERSFALVVKQVTNYYRITFQLISPLNSINKYP